MISYLELLRPFCLVEQNHLCNFERGHYGEHSCEEGKILYLAQIPSVSASEWLGFHVFTVLSSEPEDGF